MKAEELIKLLQEHKIKKGINQAIVGIETAIVWHDEMFGKTGRPDNKAVSMEIK